MQDVLNKLYAQLLNGETNDFVKAQMGRYFSHGLDKQKSLIDFKLATCKDSHPYFLEEIPHVFSHVAQPKYELHLKISIHHMAFIVHHYLSNKYPTKNIKITTVLSCTGRLCTLSSRVSKLITTAYNTYGYMNIHRPLHMGGFIATSFDHDSECR